MENHIETFPTYRFYTGYLFNLMCSLEAMRSNLLLQVALAALLLPRVPADASICVSAADCCSFSSAARRAIPCCGSSITGPDALRCGDNHRCYRGDTPCKSSVDDPLCNIPHTTVDATIDEALGAWRQCRRDSTKMQSLHQLEQYGGGASLLIDAAAQGRTDSMTWLLEGGRDSDVNARGANGATALHAAAANGPSTETTDAIQLLLAHGADPNTVDAFGFTPLHRVIQANNFHGAVLLLSSGANLSIHAPGGDSLLHLAAYENDRDLAQLLLGFGADPFARNDRGVASFEAGLFDLSVPPHHMT